MGVLFAGFLRAPMTSVFMVLEVSGNYSIIVPVIVANTFAYVISRGLQPVPIFDLLTRQDGLELPSMEEQREEDILRVEDAMRPVKGLVLDAEQTLEQALRMVDQTESGPTLVRLTRAAEQRHEGATPYDGGGGKGAANLGSLLPIRHLPYLHPDHPLETALRYVDRWPIVPVVNRADFRQLEGIICQRDVLERYGVRRIDIENHSVARETGSLPPCMSACNCSAPSVAGENATKAPSHSFVPIGHGHDLSSDVVLKALDERIMPSCMRRS